MKKWREDNALWVPGNEHSKAYNTCGTCRKPLTPAGKHTRAAGATDGHQPWRLWDGRVRPGELERNNPGVLLLGRGLLPKVLADLNVTEILNAPPVCEIPIFSVDTLRDYQAEALRCIFSKKWGRIALPTNAGKGAIIALAAHSLALAQRRALILCDEVAVFQALKQEIVKWTGRPPSLIEAGVKDIPTELITLAMVPTLVRRDNGEWRKWLEGVDALLLDEADKATSSTWQRLLSRAKNTLWRVGFSGTFIEQAEMTVPERTLQETIGPVLMRKTNAEMIERGISAKPFVELVPYKHDLEIPYDWNEIVDKKGWIYRAAIVLNERRNRMLIDLLDPSNSNCIIVNYIEHGDILETVIPNSVFLNGRDKPERRERVLGQFRRGEVQNLIVTRILDRGTNELGRVTGLIFASGEGSARQNLQRIGRGLRRADGKEFLFLRDVIDTGHPYLERASTGRVELYNSEGFDITINARPTEAAAGIRIDFGGLSR